jgi:hypothetical protein
MTRLATVASFGARQNGEYLKKCLASGEGFRKPAMKLSTVPTQRRATSRCDVFLCASSPIRFQRSK